MAMRALHPVAAARSRGVEAGAIPGWSRGRGETLLSLQRLVGNRAVAAMRAAVQRDEAAGAESEHARLANPAAGPTTAQMAAPVRTTALKATEVQSDDGGTVLFDPYDETLVAIRPDGTGKQLTYDFAHASDGRELDADEERAALVEFLPKLKTAKGGEIVECAELYRSPDGLFRRRHFPRITSSVELSADRVKALEWFERNQGTAESDSAKTKRLGGDVANDKEWAKFDNGERLTQPERPRNGRTTTCNTFMGGLGVELDPDPSKGPKAGVAGTYGRDFGKFMLPEAAKLRGSWREPGTAGGPTPGDIIVLYDQLEGRRGHVAGFKSRRPGPVGTEIWTTVDGGQGDYAGNMRNDERIRVYHPKKTILVKGGKKEEKQHVLESTIADGGQSGLTRTLEGWVDIEAHLAHGAPPGSPPPSRPGEEAAGA